MPWTRRIEEVEFVSIDLETTGLAPGFDRITEVGAARFRVRRDGTVDPGPVFDQLVHPERTIPAHIEALTGITDAMLSDAPVIADVWPRLTRFLIGDGAPTVLLAHNAAFDLAFLVAAAHAEGERWVGPPAACTVRIARHTLPRAPRYGLSVLVDWLQLDGSPTYHRALADALHARNVFARCVATRDARSLSSLGVDHGVPVPNPSEFAFEVPDRLRPIELSIPGQELVALSYKGGSKGRAWRPATPLAFYKREGQLFLRAWCHLDELEKSFRCDRIKTHVTGERAAAVARNLVGVSAAQPFPARPVAAPASEAARGAGTEGTGASSAGPR